MAGFDSALSERFTIAVDFSDQIAIDRIRTVVPTVDTGVSPDALGVERVSTHEQALAVGLKSRLAGDLMLTANVLMRLNDNGLRARIVPNIAISRIF
jgi:hypothetical protein